MMLFMARFVQSFNGLSAAFAWIQKHSQDVHFPARFSSIIGLMALCVLVFSGCSATGTTPSEQRAYIEQMRSRVLEDVYAVSPSAQAHVARSPGYAVFSNAQVNMLFVAAGTGYGVGKSGGRSTYMKMGEVGIGLGLGIKDFRVLLVFNTERAYNNFVTHGWTFGADADAVAKSDDKGSQYSGGVNVGDITVYQLTENGLALQATVKGTKYWQDPALN